MLHIVRFLSICILLALTVLQVQAFPGAQKGSSGGATAGTGTQAVAMSGTVIETMNAGSYTYVHVEQDGLKGWAAIPAAKIEVGSNVAVDPGAVMNNFYSRSLDRTFEQIIFSSGLTVQ